MSDTPETDNQWRRMYEEADWRTVEAEVLKRERDELRRLVQAGYAKAERAEKMLRIAAAKADEWRERAEKLAFRSSNDKSELKYEYEELKDLESDKQSQEEISASMRSQ